MICIQTFVNALLFAQKVLGGKQVHIILTTSCLLHVLHKHIPQRHKAFKIGGKKYTRNENDFFFARSYSLENCCSSNCLCN